MSTLCAQCDSLSVTFGVNLGRLASLCSQTARLARQLKVGGPAKLAARPLSFGGLLLFLPVPNVVSPGRDVTHFSRIHLITMSPRRQTTARCASGRWTKAADSQSPDGSPSNSQRANRNTRTRGRVQTLSRKTQQPKRPRVDTVWRRRPISNRNARLLTLASSVRLLLWPRGRRSSCPGGLPEDCQTLSLKNMYAISSHSERVSRLNTKRQTGTKAPQCEEESPGRSAGLLTCRGLKWRGAAKGERLFLSRCRSELELWNPLR